ncbi:MAG TPA: FHA domain-containing protein [Polyangiaceae bacterium]
MNSPPDVDRHPFTVVVSEKGGAERRQTFDTTELNVGRVQGNELMLPKGNVSKRHARLLFRDGRFIVTDLNSTNGTYVNRRRIAQATIVREGDRIYIGDFVLRIELGALDTFDDKTGNTGRPSFPSVPDRGSSSDPGLRLPAQEAPATPSSPDELTQLPAASGLHADSDGPTPNLAARERMILAEAEAAASSVSASSEQGYSPSAARQRAAVQAVVSHVLDVMDEASLFEQVPEGLAQRVRALALDKAKSLAEGRELSEGLTAEGAAEDAAAELLELGPLGALLTDASVNHIAIPRYDQLTVTRAGRLVPQVPTFSCEWSLNAALRRLAARASYRLPESESLIEFSLPDGTRVAAARGAVAPTGTLLLVRKPRRVSSTLEKLVRRGAISRAMATFLGQCVLARLNLLVVGPREEGALTLLSALSAACGGEHLVALSGIDDVVAHSESATRLNISEAGVNATQLLQVAARIPEARVVATLADGRDAAAAIEAIGDGIDGVLAAFRAPDLRRAMARLPADISVARAGLSLEAAREWLKSSFDVVLEVMRLRDGRLRVLRIAEFGDVGPQGLELVDIFRFVVERVATGGAIEGSFVAGDRPKVVDQMASVGIETDASLFARSQIQSR